MSLVRKSVWLVASSSLLLGACSFRHGSLMHEEDAPAGDDDAHVDDAPIIDARPIDGPPDAPPDARVCPAAPAGCTAFTCNSTASCYYICSTTKRSWSNANAACGSITSGASAACLATINSQAEQNCIVTATNPMFANSNWVWFGFRQDANPVEPAGNWTWECGSSSYVAGNWGNGEPNNTGGNEDCAALTDGGGWFDANCSNSARYVCELP